MGKITFRTPQNNCDYPKRFPHHQCSADQLVEEKKKLLKKGKQQLHHSNKRRCQRLSILLLIIGTTLICSTTVVISLSNFFFVVGTSLEESHQKFLDIHMGRRRQVLIKEGARTVVAYSAPTSLDRGLDSDEGNKNGLYLKNFEYFLNHGIDCEKHSTVIIMTKPVAEKYGKQIERMNSRECRETQYSIDILVREDKCYDMQSMAVFLQEYDIASYDFFVYVNCGMVGPKTSGEMYWTDVFTSRLSDTVKLVGISLNIHHHPHIQSFTLAFDRAGMEIIKESGAVYDCAVENEDMTEEIRWEIVQRYEIGMSRAIINAGYSISALVGAVASPLVVNKCIIENIRTAAKEAFKDKKGDPPVIKKDKFWNTNESTFILPWGDDLWYERFISMMGRGKLPLWSDFVFFKPSRGFLLPEIFNEVGYDNLHDFKVLEDLNFVNYIKAESFRTRVEESYRQFLDIQTRPSSICDDSLLASPVDED